VAKTTVPLLQTWLVTQRLSGERTAHMPVGLCCAGDVLTDGIPLISVVDQKERRKSVTSTSIGCTSTDYKYEECVSK
jgi:hypothetical protein